MFDIATPALIKIGRGATAELGSFLANKGVTNPLIVTDSFLANAPILKKITRSLKQYGVFDGIGSDPDLEMIKTGLKVFNAGGYDGLIGFGGGSPMDGAKLINLMKHSDGDMLQWRVPNSPAMDTLPLVCIPTTAGTGSEVTRGAVVTNPDNQEKVVFMGTACLADIAVLDADLIDDLPLRIAADTGLDALTHALESLVSKKATPYTKALAALALEIIGRNLKGACLKDDPQAKEAMLSGAAYAGMAFSNSSVAMIHGMSRPLGSFFHVPHGLSNAMLLPSVTEFSVTADMGNYAKASRVCGFSQSGDSDEEACKNLLKSLKELCQDLSVPSLEEFGVERKTYFDSIEKMTEQAIASGSPANNPRVPETEEIIQLYKNLWR